MNIFSALLWVIVIVATILQYVLGYFNIKKNVLSICKVNVTLVNLERMFKCDLKPRFLLP